jgi:hypothetical protein
MLVKFDAVSHQSNIAQSLVSTKLDTVNDSLRVCDWLISYRNAVSIIHDVRYI